MDDGKQGRVVGGKKRCSGLEVYQDEANREGGHVLRVSWSPEEHSEYI